MISTIAAIHRIQTLRRVTRQTVEGDLTAIEEAALALLDELERVGSLLHDVIEELEQARSARAVGRLADLDQTTADRDAAYTRIRILEAQLDRLQADQTTARTAASEIAALEAAWRADEPDGWLVQVAKRLSGRRWT